MVHFLAHARLLTLLGVIDGRVAIYMSSRTTRRVASDSAGKRASHHLALHHDAVRQTTVVEAPAVACNELRAGQQTIIVMLVLVRSSLRYWSAKKGPCVSHKISAL